MQKLIVRRQAEEGTLPSDLHPLLKKLYSHRGITCEEQLERSIKSLYPFTQLKGLAQATQLLAKAIEERKRLLILGDFDADGATSTSVAVKALLSLGAAHVDYLVPNRFEYGYGLTPEIVDVAKTKNPDVLITVDNGISSIAGVKHAKALGMQVIITDHHLAGAQLPDADAIVNPNQPGCEFPSKNLAGVGVIFYVMLALRAHLRELEWYSRHGIVEPNLATLLDLVALGTVADVVPLDKNNRILVHQGLQRIRAGHCCPGIKALLIMAGRDITCVSASDIGFALGPRLNAAGRLDDMSLGIELLLTPSQDRAQSLAYQLNELNIERRSIESEMKTQAFSILDELQLTDIPHGICVYQPDWHQGVIGILAARIKDQYHRPAIAFAKGDGNEIKGSARSIQGIHIRDVLDQIATQHPTLIQKFGGHAMAAGLTIEENNFSWFSQLFNDVIQQWATEDILTNKIYSDGELTSEYFNLDTATLLRDSGPWGQRFPEPLFHGEFEILQQRLVGRQHLKLQVKLPHEDTPYSAIAFNVDLEQWPRPNCQRVRLVYGLDTNEYGGLRSVQLRVEHLEALI